MLSVEKSWEPWIGFYLNRSLTYFFDILNIFKILTCKQVFKRGFSNIFWYFLIFLNFLLSFKYWHASVEKSWELWIGLAAGSFCQNIPFSGKSMKSYMRCMIWYDMISKILWWRWCYNNVVMPLRCNNVILMMVMTI